MRCLLIQCLQCDVVDVESGWKLAVRSKAEGDNYRIINSELMLNNYSVLFRQEKSASCVISSASILREFKKFQFSRKIFFKVFQGREKFFFSTKLTYSINIDGVSRCPLQLRIERDARMNHYDTVTVFYSLQQSVSALMHHSKQIFDIS